jgi:hypothetical protein
MMNIPSDEELRELLHMDAGMIAQQITGKSYKEDEETSKLMAGIHLLKSVVAKECLAVTDDTYWGMPFDDAIRIAHGEGFKELCRWDVPRFKYNTDELEREDVSILFYSPEGFYLILESYGHSNGKLTVNIANLTYNIRLDPVIADKCIEEMQLDDVWRAANSDWYARTRRGENPPKVLTDEERELRNLFLFHQGNTYYDEENRQMYRLCDGKDVRIGLRLKLHELRQQTSWKILPKLVSWEWHQGFNFMYKPEWMREKEEKDLSFEERQDLQREQEKKWLEHQLTMLPEEHQYLRDIPIQ